MSYQYTPSPWQKKFHESESRIKIVWAGRRAGKGRAVLSELMVAIAEAAKTPFLADKEMAKAANLPVGYDLTNTLEPAIHIALPVCVLLALVSIVKNEPTLEPLLYDATSDVPKVNFPNDPVDVAEPEILPLR